MAKIENALSDFLRNIPIEKCLRQRTRIYAPTCYGGCLPAVDRLVEEVNRIFGGSTVYDATGSWIGPKGLEVEPVKVIEVGMNRICHEEASELARAVRRYADEAQQSEITIDDENLYLIRTPDLYVGGGGYEEDPSGLLENAPRGRGRRRLFA